MNAAQGGRTPWIVGGIVGLLSGSPACALGEQPIGSLTAGGAAGGSGSSEGGDSLTGTTSDSGTDAPVLQCTDEFVIEGSVVFTMDPGPDGVGFVYVRATASECMLGPALALWVSPQVVAVRDLLDAGVNSVPFALPPIPCNGGVPGVVRVSAFLAEGAVDNPSDPIPGIGDMVNALTGDGVAAYSEDIAAGYTCIDVDTPAATVTYELDQWWFNDPPPGADSSTG